MLKNYIYTALRNLWRHKAFTAINVLGLSIGISAALVIFMIAQYELGYDKIETDADRVYRITLDLKYNGTEGHSAAVPAPLSAAIQREVTGVQTSVPVMQFQSDATATVSVERKGFANPFVYKKQADIVFTNQQYFSLLPYRWLAGSAASALSDPFTVVLSASRARQYFPSLTAAEVIGRQIHYNNDFTATVSGVVEDLAARTSFSAVEFVSFATIAETRLQDNFMMNVWNDWMAYSQVYIKLAAGSNAAHTEQQLQTLLNKYNQQANKDAANSMHFHLQPLSDVHFNSLYAGFNQRLAHKPTLYGLFAVAAFLLLLACINFINLTTANASRRAREIGIRKTMGSSRAQLVLQFLGETFSVTTFACILSFFMVPVLLGLFADFIPPGLQFQPFSQPSVFVFLGILSVTVTLLSGLYPAFILSAYKPVAVLKSQSVVSGSTRQAWVRRTLTVSQFIIAQFFVIATVMVSKQVNYSLRAELGFDKEGIITFTLPRDTVATHRQQMLNIINSVPGVALASTGFLAPIQDGAAFTNILYPAKPEIKAQVQLRWGDANYIKVYNIKLLAGRNVLASDSIKEFVINNTYANVLGFKKPGDAVGQTLSFNNKQIPIVGVMQDFHEQSMHVAITPLVFGGNNGYFFHVRLKPATSGAQNWQPAIKAIQKAYKNIYPNEDFDYQFIDDTIAGFYQQEQHTASLLGWATGLSILISCMGLLGLVMYTIHTRVKEIGIRKVLGAPVAHIIAILSRDFLRLVLAAFIIAAPVAWWASYQWLQNFAYRTAISIWVFLISGGAMLCVALLTLSMQTIRAAMANPVKSLRSE